MAFEVTPTSGAGPYTYTADFSARGGLDVGLYSLQFFQTTAVGSCPASGTSGSPQPSIASQLLSEGTAVSSSIVDSGSCRTATLIIREVATNSIVESASVNIDRTA